ncbi:MAG: MFS transporter [Desulfobacterales bacterium]
MPPTAKARFASRKAMISWAAYDWAGQSFPTVIQTFIFSAYFIRRVAESETAGTAQWGNALTVAGLIVAFGGPVLGAIADQAGRRKPWIAAFTILCVVFTGLMWFVTPASDSLVLALILLGGGTIASEYAMIFYNSMLPTLVSSDRMGRWSGVGWSFGYAGGLACLALALLAFVSANQPWFGLERESAEDVRATFVLAAGWYLIFSIPLFLFTPDVKSKGKKARKAVGDGLHQLAESVRQIRKYANILKFLVARMIYNEGLATIFAFGGVYAAGTFDMDEQQVLGFGVALSITAGLGAATFSFVDDRIGSKPTILLSLAGIIFSGTGILLVHKEFWFWSFGMLLGIFVGPVQASSRSFLGRAAPEKLQSQIFGLYAFSGKATAFLGPFLVGWLTYFSGSQRIGMSAIMALFLIGGILLLFVSPPENKSSKSPKPQPL